LAYAPGIAEFVDRCNQIMPPDFYTWPIEEQRRLYENLTVEFRYDMPPGVTSADTSVRYDGHEAAVRIYRPPGQDSQSEPGGVIFYVRGGGFVVGSLATHHTVVAELAAKTGLATVALDFRLAPEHPFPAAIEDCYAGLRGVLDDAGRFGVDPRRAVVAGDSSGGNMAVVLAMMCRDRGGPKLAGQALISPVLDFTRWQNGGADAPLLTGGEMEYYTRCYCPAPGQVRDPYVSPLVSGGFADLPPAYIMGAEMDSLRGDGESYARSLQSAGIPARHVVEPGLVHAAVRARGLSPQVADAWRRFCAATAGLAAVSQDAETQDAGMEAGHVLS
jgi:acetyl esterase